MRPSFFGSRDDLAIVLRDVGRLMPVVSAMALVSLFVPIVYHEGYAIAPLVWTAVIAAALGLALYLPFRHAPEPQLRHAMITAALGWLVVPAVGALPFLFCAAWADAGPTAANLTAFRDPANAFFESLSGFTTTGLSVAPRPDLLPHTLQWWRSFAQWIGSLGVIVVVLSILAGPRPGSATYSMYYAEARSDRILPTIRSTVRTLWWILIAFTAVSMALQWRLGTPIWQAANHAMTALSTGGFAVTAPNAAPYPNVGVMIVLMLSMLAGAISFSVHYAALGAGWRRLFSDYQTRMFLLIVLVGIAFLTLENLPRMGIAEALRSSAFHFVSAETTTGFQATGFATWSETAKLILAAGMFIGGAAGSTAGGIKIIRLVVLLKGLSWRFRQVLSPRRAVIPFRIGGTALDSADVGERLEDAALIMFLWIAFIGVGVVVLLHCTPPQFTLADIVLEVASAQGNSGLSTGITGPQMALAGKLALCFNMWVGRLEIIPVLILVRSFVARGR
ncbi:MAG: TrkH family potassium uptake protein [Thermotogota bacterium]